MYSKIQQLKENNLNKSQVSRYLKIDFKTVTKYWNMSAEEYAEYCKQLRRRKLDKYQDEILALLHRHNDYTSAQLLDILWERHPEERNNIAASTLRGYVKALRKKYNIPNDTPSRQYQAVADLQPGYQAQVDLGYITLADEDGEPHDVCAMTMVLSHSRYKYVEWFDRPPVTTDFVNFHERAFAYFRGMPYEIVYDQDRLLIVSENFGDIIYTTEFENYRQRRKFDTFICRSSDPETKGKIEAVVKYVKHNFAHHRLFTTIENLNQQCLEWLDRTGNSKIHGTTKKVPAEMFILEQMHLRQVPDLRISQILDTIISRTVRKNNTVDFNSNRYSVPLGTYESGKKVGLKIDPAQTLKIIDLETGELVAEHDLCFEKGQLVQNNHHLRDNSLRIAELYHETLQSLGGTENGAKLLDMIKLEKPRYIRDQYQYLIKTAKELTQDTVDAAIEYMIRHDFWSATVFSSVAANLDKLAAEQTAAQKVDIPERYKIVTEVRKLSEYEELAR